MKVCVKIMSVFKITPNTVDISLYLDSNPTYLEMREVISQLLKIIDSLNIEAQLALWESEKNNPKIQNCSRSDC